jgi:hypothetical protein
MDIKNVKTRRQIYFLKVHNIVVKLNLYVWMLLLGAEIAQLTPINILFAT